MTCGTKDGEIHLYSPMKAIRRKCLDCCCGNDAEVRRCHIETCSLHPYRFGRNPSRKGIGGNPRLQNQGEEISEANSTKDSEENFSGEE